jgi:hypothetical protein
MMIQNDPREQCTNDIIDVTGLTELEMVRDIEPDTHATPDAEQLASDTAVFEGEPGAC